NSTCNSSPSVIKCDWLWGVSYIYLKAVSFGSLVLFGICFQKETLGPIWQQMRRQNVLGIFIMNLSFSDMLFIFTIPLWINYYFQNHRWQLGVASCSIAGFIYYSNMYISIYLLCCISVDRCIVVSYPLHHKTHRTTCYAWAQCVIIYIVVAVLHVFVLFRDNLKDAHDDVYDNDRCYETYPIETPIALFNLVRVGVGFFVPLLVLAFSYWRILATVGQSPGLSSQTKR
uniref:G protein-coupled receptor 184 n=1 Tax=Tetraodon nigroviridis TaxID=99883 RepID=H3CQP8_TETNG